MYFERVNLCFLGRFESSRRKGGHGEEKTKSIHSLGGKTVGH